MYEVRWSVGWAKCVVLKPYHNVSCTVGGKARNNRSGVGICLFMTHLCLSQDRSPGIQTSRTVKIIKKI